MTTFLIASSLLKYWGDGLISKVTTSVEARGRRQLMERLVSGPWMEVGKLGQGEVTAAVMSEATQLSNGVFSLLSGAGTAVVVIILISASAVLTPSLLALALLFIVASAIIFRQRLKHVRLNETRLSAETTDIAEEVTSSLSDIKFLRESGSALDWLMRSQGSADVLGRLRRRQIMLPAATRTMVDSIAAIFLALVVGLALIVQGDITLGLVFVALFYRIIPRVQAVQNQINTALGQVTWIEKWESRMEALSEAPADASVLQDPVLKSCEVSWDRPPELVVRGVSHVFAGRDRPALDGIHLTISSGESLAVLGPSGSGKTTLLDILLGLFPPTSGSLEVNGKVLTPRDWNAFRRTIGIVPQDVPIRRGTVADNVLWGMSMDRRLLEEVIGMTQLHGLIGELPLGLDSFIDSKSIGLSGGQRQRIGLARALYRQPKLLVLDEATSALDLNTEKAILEAVAKVPWTMTVIIVTHRLAALDYVDRRVDLVNGKIQHSQQSMELGF
ncbi:ATP-binding cassette domain-containing protein [Arthrobacter sp. 8AJ]|uniref:ATP-binding cassette domain-containing protein n=1 Tax=Arthrobacter sp. 8AJ TaxID=2653130 RepID=UPI00135BF0AF|nr:ABC transporter ATP-binding protein [Arthrobacter sp. 8AJ]